MNKLMVCIAAIERVKKSGRMGSVETIIIHKKWNKHTFDDSNLARKFLYRKSCKLCLMVVSDSFKSIEGTEFHSLGIRVKNSCLEEFVEVTSLMM